MIYVTICESRGITELAFSSNILAVHLELRTSRNLLEKRACAISKKTIERVAAASSDEQEGYGGQNTVEQIHKR